MNHIRPLQYITDIDPIVQEVLDATAWFETEYMTVEWDGYHPTNYLEWYMAQGWVMYNKTSYWGWILGNSVEFSTAYLKRRKLQSERVLDSLITEFTSAYNEGRSINDSRYDELVTLYSVMLQQSESELTDVNSNQSTYDALIEKVIDGMETDLSTHEDAVDGVLDDFGTSELTRINAAFNAKEAELTQSLITRGMNNSTVSDTVLAGYERERAAAITDLNDKIAEQQIGQQDKLHGRRVETSRRILDARDRLFRLQKNGSLTIIDQRNKILQAMFSFMERRTDDYPGMQGLAEIAAKLGFSESASVVAPAS